MTNLLFVYGTLRPGGGFNRRLRNAILKEENCFLPPCFNMINIGGFPALIPGNNFIIGSLYFLPDNERENILNITDAIEGVSQNFYKRVTSGVYSSKSVGSFQGRAYLYVLHEKSMDRAKKPHNFDRIMIDGNIQEWEVVPPRR